MIIVVEGTKSFNDYDVFSRAMSVAMSGFDKESDDHIDVWTAGPSTINNFTAGFCNLVEKLLKQNGVKLRFMKVPSSYVIENIKYVDYMAYFLNPNERESKLVAEAKLANTELGIYKY